MGLSPRKEEATSPPSGPGSAGGRGGTGRALCEPPARAPRLLCGRFLAGSQLAQTCSEVGGTAVGGKCTPVIDGLLIGPTSPAPTRDARTEVLRPDPVLGEQAVSSPWCLRGEPRWARSPQPPASARHVERGPAGFVRRGLAQPGGQRLLFPRAGRPAWGPPRPPPHHRQPDRSGLCVFPAAQARDSVVAVPRGSRLQRGTRCSSLDPLSHWARQRR